MDQQRPDLVGFADLHAHLMSHLAFGGTFFGQPYDDGDDGIAHALGRCDETHGIDFLNPELSHKESGFPEFQGWPRHSTIAHQQACIYWVRRAYEGGLRLVCCATVNNELLGDRFGREDYTPVSDSTVADGQLEGMRKMVEFVDDQSGGKGKGWMQIAGSAAEARQIIEAGKLALVLASEMDKLGGWSTPEELRCDPRRPRRAIREELQHLRDMGVRHIGPIHLTDNAFGGAAVYDRLFDGLNKFVTKDHYKVEPASHKGIEYRLPDDKAGGGFLGFVKRLLAYGFNKQSHRSHREVRGGQANQKGLSPYGKVLLKEMMCGGWICDLAHCSQRSVDDALRLAEEFGYPVIDSHTAFRDLALRRDESSIPYKWASEGMQTAETIERIRKLGGVVAPILYQAEVKTHDGRIPNDCAGTSKSFAQAYLYAVDKMRRQGVALGSDLNGFAWLPGPRFGTQAAPGLVDDHKRRKAVDRRDQIERQGNGVCYDAPLQDYRTYRFEGEAEDGYSREEAWTLQAIALAESKEEPPRADILDRSRKARRWIINVATGLRASSLDKLPYPPETRGRAKAMQQGAFHARNGTYPGDICDRETRECCERIAPTWRKFQKMKGENAPLPRSIAGQRDFDYNLDGVAHYGLLRDLIEDLRNIGLSDTDLTPLFRSAEHFVRMWEKCERQASALRLGIVIAEVDHGEEGGDLASEHVRIRSATDEALELTGWRLEGGAHTYTFPNDFTLPGNGMVRVWTRSGENGERDLFWGRDEVVWGDEAADTAVLCDGDCGRRSVFRYRTPAEPETVEPPAFQPSERTPDVQVPVTVRESDADVDTSVDIEDGDEWHVVATGAMWSGVLLARRHGPDGRPNGAHDPKFPSLEAPPYSLVGKLDGGDYFYIGSFHGPRSTEKRHRGDKSARLYLRTNDDTPGNGWGAFKCQVRVWKDGRRPEQDGRAAQDRPDRGPGSQAARLDRLFQRLGRDGPLKELPMRTALFRHLKHLFGFLKALRALFGRH